jgi:hypothetical protein
LDKKYELNNFGKNTYEKTPSSNNIVENQKF